MKDEGYRDFHEKTCWLVPYMKSHVKRHEVLCTGSGRGVAT